MTTQAEPVQSAAGLPETNRCPIDIRTLLLVGLSLSIGWGIRGQFGHEYGAMLPGALAAMAMALISGRPDWQRRIAFFGLFGALGWAFGGQMAYMVVISYTESGNSLTVWYGFAMLFVIGFLWGAMGGAGTALPAYLSRERLIEFFRPMTIIFIVFITFDAFVSESVSHSWVAQETAVWLNRVFHGGGWLFPFSDRYSLVAQWLNHTWPHVQFFASSKGRDALEWYDSEYQAASLALITALIYAGVRRKIDRATSLIMHMCVGWWIGFLIFPVLLHIRMLPVKSDNWAGMVGLIAATLIFFWRDKQPGINLVTIVTGIVGGLGFATACIFKQLEMYWLLPYCSTNWHSILEQTYGLINGLGVAIAMLMVLRLAPRQSDDPPTARWTESWSIFFVLVIITYVNIVKELEDWVHNKAMPGQLYFLTAEGWFNFFYLLIAITAVILLVRQLRKGLPMLSMNWLGRGQLLYLTLLWWMMLGDLGKEITAFGPQRLITEGVIFVNCLLCTLMVFFWTRTKEDFQPSAAPNYRPLLGWSALAGLAILMFSSVLYWRMVRVTWHDTPVDTHNIHIRFGEHATRRAPLE
jgi:hypothetical protein